MGDSRPHQGRQLNQQGQDKGGCSSFGAKCIDPVDFQYGKTIDPEGRRVAGVQVRSQIYTDNGKLDKGYVLDRIKFSIETDDEGRQVLGIRIKTNGLLLKSDDKTDIISLDKDGQGGLSLRVVNRDGSHQKVSIDSDGEVKVGPPNQRGN